MWLQELMYFFLWALQSWWCELLLFLLRAHENIKTQPTCSMINYNHYETYVSTQMLKIDWLTIFVAMNHGYLFQHLYLSWVLVDQPVLVKIWTCQIWNLVQRWTMITWEWPGPYSIGQGEIYCPWRMPYVQNHLEDQQAHWKEDLKVYWE